MSDELKPRQNELVFTDIHQFVEDAARRTQASGDGRRQLPLSYRLTVGRETLRLDLIEFRILVFLASRPYHPFTRRRIAEAVSTEDFPVTEESVDQHIASLRSQLAIFRDYVQAVPHVGYRFKA